MTGFKKAIAVLLVVVMILPFASFANGEKSDIDGHWAEEAIEYMIDNETIQEAIDDAKAGDVIVVREGEFKEEIHIEKPITLKGAGAGKTI